MLPRLPAIREHRTLFGEDQLKQVGTDKGYYSASNIKAIEALAINADGVQRPTNIRQRPPPEVIEAFKRRRAGIEPLIQPRASRRQTAIEPYGNLMKLSR
jgi:hypothetical protein